ncbi:hypothetical protein OG320_19125 [Microbispora sp. NBC_01189]|uniref:hypothetical protein n=1 Tax=Microbispora sp. NBC_01189 TaxID=2903583 RepID=UPI002E15E077|nr:hypothetical protein OG320_19125 [Microbispora sp. NBC_01189]
MPHYNKAYRLYNDIIQEWIQQQEEIDPHDYPYILNKGKIHKLSCRHPPEAALVPFPEDLHAFGVIFEYCREDLNALFKYLIERSSRMPKRINIEYVRDIMIWHGTAVAQAEMC